jgi:hypothetical protein
MSHYKDAWAKEIAAQSQHPSKPISDKPGAGKSNITKPTANDIKSAVERVVLRYKYEKSGQKALDQKSPAKSDKARQGYVIISPI